MTKLNAEQLADKLNASTDADFSQFLKIIAQADMQKWDESTSDMAVFMNDGSVVAYETGRGWSVYR